MHLYRVWRVLEQKGLAEDADEDRYIDLQDIVISLMEVIPCQSLEDVLYKLAIWRWETLDKDPDAAGRGERLAYSALRDIAAMTGKLSVLEKAASTERAA